MIRSLLRPKEKPEYPRQVIRGLAQNPTIHLERYRKVVDTRVLEVQLEESICKEDQFRMFIVRRPLYLYNTNTSP